MKNWYLIFLSSLISGKDTLFRPNSEQVTYISTLDSGIDVSKAGNKHRAWKIWQKFEVFVMKFWFFTLNLITVGPFNKAVGPGKNTKIINVGPTFIPESRVYPLCIYGS